MQTPLPALCVSSHFISLHGSKPLSSWLTLSSSPFGGSESPAGSSNSPALPFGIVGRDPVLSGVTLGVTFEETAWNTGGAY